jgi:hypothetical protein
MTTRHMSAFSSPSQSRRPVERVAGKVVDGRLNLADQIALAVLVDLSHHQYSIRPGLRLNPQRFTTHNVVFCSAAWHDGREG